MSGKNWKLRPHFFTGRIRHGFGTIGKSVQDNVRKGEDVNSTSSYVCGTRSITFSTIALCHFLMKHFLWVFSSTRGCSSSTHSPCRWPLLHFPMDSFFSRKFVSYNILQNVKTLCLGLRFISEKENQNVMNGFWKKFCVKEDSQYSSVRAGGAPIWW